MDLHDPIVVRVTCIIWNTVAGDLLLEIDIGDWRADVV